MQISMGPVWTGAEVVGVVVAGLLPAEGGESEETVPDDALPEEGSGADGGALGSEAGSEWLSGGESVPEPDESLPDPTVENKEDAWSSLLDIWDEPGSWSAQAHKRHAAASRRPARRNEGVRILFSPFGRRDEPLCVGFAAERIDSL